MKVAYQSKINSTPEPACPIDPRIDELLVDIADTIDRCDGLRVADLINQPSMKFVVWDRDRRQEKYLSGVDRARDIRRVHARANAILGFDRVFQRRHAPCPSCDLPTLGNYVGDNTVFCGDEDCGLAISLDEYDKLCIELSEKPNA